MTDQHHEGVSRRDREELTNLATDDITRRAYLTNLVMDHMERRSDRREAADDWGGTLGTVLDRLQEAWTNACKAIQG
jgi:hypothetical protein